MARRNIWMTAAAVLTAAMLAAGCGKNGGTADTAPVQSEASAEQTKESADQADQTETDQKTEAETGSEAEGEESPYYMLQGTVIKMDSDQGVFTLQADDGHDYDIKLSDIRDAETEIKEDVQIAIGCIGTVEGDLSESVLVVALPEQEEWTIAEAEGTTVSNAMSTFVLKTEDGRELSFLKDNCPMEEGALSADSGDRIRVAYVESQGMNYPLEILAAD